MSKEISPEQARKAAALLGELGGKVKGQCKKRGNHQFYSELGKLSAKVRRAAKAQQEANNNKNGH